MAGRTAKGKEPASPNSVKGKRPRGPKSLFGGSIRSDALGTEWEDQIRSLIMPLETGARRCPSLPPPSCRSPFPLTPRLWLLKPSVCFDDSCCTA